MIELRFCAACTNNTTFKCIPSESCFDERSKVNRVPFESFDLWDNGRALVGS